MINKKFLLLTITIVLIASLGAISAVDVESNDTLSIQSSDIEQTSQIDDTTQQSSTLTKNIQTITKKATTTQVEDYTQLYNNLTNTEASEETTIILEGDSDTYTITDSITLSTTIKSLNIQGNGKTITGNNEKTFLIVNHACNIILNNLTVTNCNSTNTYGAAISTNGGSLTLNNTQFTNNNFNPSVEVAYGGAIALNNTNLTIENSNLTSNEAQENTDLERLGGAIYFNGTDNQIKITDSVFESNGYNNGQQKTVEVNPDEGYSYNYYVSLSYGGALYIETQSKTTINKTTFNKNNAYEGAAIFYNGDGEITIENSLFDSNGQDTFTSKEELGGAICILSNGKTEIKNTTFTNNIANKGGAIQYIGYNASNLEITDSNFTQNGNTTNVYAYYGGAINIETLSNVTITNTTFTQNQVTGYGGAIDYIGFLSSNLKIKNVTFDSNGGVNTYVGGAINIDTFGNTIIEDSIFTSNLGGLGGVISYNTHQEESPIDLIINNTIFDSNVAYMGASLQISTNANTIIDNTNFTNNAATIGGAIDYNGIENDTLKIFNSNFNTNGNNDDYDIRAEVGGALNIKSNTNVTIENTNFTSNCAEVGGAIGYIGKENSSLEIYDSNFKYNGFIEGMGEAYNGGAIQIETEGNVTLNNNNFTYDYGYSGGAIYYVSIPNEQTQIVNSKNILVINNTLFEKHGKTSSSYPSLVGGTLYIESNSTVLLDNIEIYESLSEEYGGAIAYLGYDQSTLVVNNSKFDSCGAGDVDFAPHNGGALYIETEGNLTIIENSEFTNNIVRQWYGDSETATGGAIHYQNMNNNSTLIIKNSTFDSNGDRTKYTITQYAGAVYLNTTGNVSIYDSKFMNNIANYSAALHYINPNENTSININNTLFESNGLYYDDNSLSVEGTVITLNTYGNISILNSEFKDNVGRSVGPILIVNSTDLLINNTLFDSNRAEYIEEGLLSSDGGALIIMDVVKTIIDDSSFTNNYAGSGGALTYGTILDEDNDKSNYSLSIINSLFDSNRGTEAIFEFVNGNVSIVNTNFTNNTLFISGEELGEIETETLLFSVYYTTLYVDNCNFIENGYPNNLSKKEFNMLEELEGGLIYFNGPNDNLTIENSNFISNKFTGSIILYKGVRIDSHWDSGQYVNEYYSNSTMIINNTSFKNNTYFVKEEEGSIYILGNVLFIGGNAVINNSNFISNTLNTEFVDMRYVKINYDISGIIYEMIQDNINYSCNVTNSVFVANEQSNFIINNSKIILNITPKNDYSNEEPLDDNYIPDFGDVIIYLDESETGTSYKLIAENITVPANDTQEEYNITIVYVDGFTVNEENYVIKMILNQTSQSKYYDKELFNNNTYYFILPHDYLISVDTISPVSIGDNTTIKGKVYYINSTGDEVTLNNHSVEIYINGTYINTVNTNENGEYELNYSCNVLGTHNVTVTFNETIYLPKLVNSTQFEVVIRDSVLNINTSETTFGEKTNITFTLKDTDDKAISDAFIYFYVDDKLANGTTDENGTFTYECEIDNVGNNYVLAFYDGNYSYTSAINSTIFHINRVNTTITVTATNTTINNESTITIKLVDANGNNISQVPIVVVIDEETLYKETDENGECTFTYTAKRSGENYVEVLYEGNETYIDSYNSTLFVAERINTTTTATATVTEVGNLTFEVTITGKDGITITNGTVTIYDENDEAVAVHNIDSEKTTITMHDITSGTYKINVTYNGNDTYNPSTSTQTVTIKAQANVEITVNNDTEGNVEVEVTLTDENGEPLSEQEVNITLPNGTTVTEKTDKYGKVKVTDTTTEAGNATVKVTVPTTDNINGTTADKTFTIEPDYQKIIDEMNKTIEQQNKTIQELDKAIDQLNDTVQEQDKTIQELDKAIDQLNDTVQEQDKTIQEKDKAIDQLNDTVQEQNKTISDLEDKLDELNKTSDMTVVAENSTVDNTKVIVALSNEMGTPLSNAEVTVQNSNGETVATATTDNDGVAIIPVDTREGTENLTVIYQGNENFTPVNKTISVTTTKNNVTVTVDSVNGIIGENITLTAHITDINGNPVSGGNLVFKLNGKTLRVDGRFDSSASAWKFNVKDGIVTITIQADLYLRNAKNLTASYSGSYKYYEAKSATVVAQIKKRDAQLTLTISPTKQKQYQTITFTAKLTDTTPNYKNTTAINTNTQVIFKVNDKTLKDEKGNAIKVKVTNGQASYKYTVPHGMGGINKDGTTRNYNVTALLVSDTYYPDTKDESYFNVERSSTTINIEKTTVNNNNQLSIKATLTDYKGNNLIGTNDVNIKINGKTYTNPNTNKTQNFKVTNGVIDLSNLQVNKKITIKSVTIVTGARQAYLGQRTETTNIVKV